MRAKRGDLEESEKMSEKKLAAMLVIFLAVLFAMDATNYLLPEIGRAVGVDGNYLAYNSTGIAAAEMLMPVFAIVIVVIYWAARNDLGMRISPPMRAAALVLAIYALIIAGNVALLL